MSRFFERAQDATLSSECAREDWASESRPYRVLVVTSNKGGVGKTTIAANLAVYLRAFREDLPILLLGFDDETTLDRMFSLGPVDRQHGVTSALRGGSFAPVVRMGQFGVHHVLSCTDVEEAARLVHGTFRLQTILQRTDWRGLVIIDTKSDFGILTRNALAASDLTIAVVKDQSSLIEAQRVFDQLAAWGVPRDRARVLLSMVNLRIKYRDENTPDILALLIAEIRKRGYPLIGSFISTSPKIESLCTNPEQRPVPVLTGAPDSLVHRQMHHIASDVLKMLEEMGLPSHGREPRKEVEPPRPAPAVVSRTAEALEVG